MKKFIAIFALAAGILLTSNNAHAQNINISINIGNQPAWGPVGYDYVDYYYFPDFNSYYDINSGIFIYFDRGRWISAQYLPAIYRHFDLYRVYKVALNMHKPWLYNKRHIKYYSRYKNYRGHQVVIRDSRDQRYYKSRYNTRPWTPDRYENRPHANNRPDYNFNRPESNKRPDHNRPEANRPNNNNNGNKNRPDNNRDKVTTKPNNSSRPNYKPNNEKKSEKKNNNNSNRSSRNSNSNRDSGRQTYVQTRF